MKKTFFLLSFTLTLSLVAQEYSKTLPELKVFDDKGEVFTQEQLVKGTYSYFIYFSPTCGHCKTAFKTLEIKSEQLSNAKDVSIYPVSANTQEQTLAFFKNLAPNIYKLDNVKVLIDDNDKFADTFLVGGYPAGYLYDKDNKLVQVFDGTTEVVAFLRILEKKK